MDSTLVIVTVIVIVIVTVNLQFGKYSLHNYIIAGTIDFVMIGLIYDTMCVSAFVCVCEDIYAIYAKFMCIVFIYIYIYMVSPPSVIYRVREFFRVH